MEDHIAVNSQCTLSPTKKNGTFRFTKPVEIPLGNDVIFSLPQFCIPGKQIILLKQRESNLWIQIKSIRYTLLTIRPVQISNFSCAKPNVTEPKSLFKFVCINRL